MSEKEKRESIEQYVIDYEKCWDELREFHRYMEMIAGEKGAFKVTELMGRIELKYKHKMIVQ